MRATPESPSTARALLDRAGRRRETGGPMTRKISQEERRRFEVLIRMLKDRQSEIRSKLRSLRETLPSEMAQVRDAEEQSMEEFVVGMDFALMEMETETLRKIDEALLRLEDGKYGVCAECDEAISEARLRALPFASLCRDCQQRHEDDEEDVVRNARAARLFEEAPPASGGRERRGSGKATRAWGSAAEEPPSGAMRTSRPARAGRVG